MPLPISFSKRGSLFSISLFPPFILLLVFPLFAAFLIFIFFFPSSFCRSEEAAYWPPTLFCAVSSAIIRLSSFSAVSSCVDWSVLLTILSLRETEVKKNEERGKGSRRRIRGARTESAISVVISRALNRYLIAPSEGADMCFLRLLFLRNAELVFSLITRCPLAFLTFCELLCANHQSRLAISLRSPPSRAFLVVGGLQIFIPPS